MRFRIGWPKLDRPAKCLFGFGMATLVLKHNAEIALRPGISRIDRDGPVKRRLGFREPATEFQNVAEVEMRKCVLWAG